MTTSAETRDRRRAAILEAAAEIFLRYGYRKTSMDDLARAAGLSRQGLYLHFKAKEELAQAVIAYLLQVDEVAYRAALARHDLNAIERLLCAFEAFHGRHIGQPGQQDPEAVFEAGSGLIGDLPLDHERQFVAAVAEFLVASGAARLTSRAEVGPRELAETLLAASFGVKHRAATTGEYRDRMAVALRIVLADVPSGQASTGTRAVSNFPNR